MITRVLLTALFVTAALGAGGCSDGAKEVEPKLANGATPDPRLQPEQAGGGKAAPQPAVKGD